MRLLRDRSGIQTPRLSAEFTFPRIMLCLDLSAHRYCEEIYVQSTTDKTGSPFCGLSEWRKYH